MFTAKLIGQSDGYVVSREFQEERAAIQWLQGAGLREFEDQEAHGEVWKDGSLCWTKSGLKSVEQQERDWKRGVARSLARRGIVKKGYL